MDRKEEKEEIANLQLTESKLLQWFVLYDQLKFEVKTAKYSKIPKWYVYFWFWTIYNKNFKFLPIVYSLK